MTKDEAIKEIEEKINKIINEKKYTHENFLSLYILKATLNVIKSNKYPGF